MQTTQTTAIPTEEEADEAAVLNAQLKHNQAIAGHHVEILKRIQRLERIGGTLDYKESTLEALKAFGGEIHLTFLTMVLGDNLLLATARKELEKKGMIEVITEKNRKILKLVTHSA